MIYLFDIDGTLLLSGGAGTRALESVFFARHGHTGAMAGVDCGGKTDAMIVAEMFASKLGRAPEPAEAAALLDDYVPRLRAELAIDDGFRLMPSVIATLDFLAGVATGLGIATGNIRAAAEAKLERAGLDHHFAFGGYGCDDGDRAGLVRVAIARACQQHGPGAAEAIVVVGDTTRDIAAARACGVRVLAVATGSQSPGELAAANPDAVFDSLDELPAWHASAARR